MSETNILGLPAKRAAVAMIYPKTQYGREGEIRKKSGFDETYLQRARAVLAHSSEPWPWR